ncbi:class I SAM-dependent methyltransferase [Neosynechococcus sphagnicola]|uniref:class I SAM-dependent methyltransferase n=1 Tax=Neosynechococcus sphagnicola TaxID=1501145 RepID=UPI00068BD74A|nr:class I SAM-dependent methyltransferase [Neosynechococcus sphagnicola]
MATTDYHDYLIKDGQFIGAFEAMYQNCPDPWGQDSLDYLSHDLALPLLSRRRYHQLLDLGCGKGRLTQRLQVATGATVTAIDISPTAVAAAQARYPEIQFLAAPIPPLPFPDASFDLVVSAELLWYVLPQLPALFAEIQRVLIPGGHYLMVQQFYQPGEQKYGNEMMQSPADLLPMLPFQVVQEIEVNRFSNYKYIALVAHQPTAS